ncbi:hypothetical protein QT381_01925 [Galbitalea sp. SE-J8]|uniref:hypothetical protein n=1 Tax=Galbitalea sp. SE-J8 TaxID=3054952 RepID=UPI00259D2795|nr:hypothetical protein [Galbitalea sp. SE-J8]MDM4761761.1 hypothetical protein [Galbitalea sp. SE-J8]
MKATTFGRIGATLGAAALIGCAVTVPAFADTPTSGTALVGLGSDTTQDVIGAIAAASNGAIASFDAVGSTTVVTRPGGAAIPRLSGSGAGRDALLVAIGQAATKSGVAVAQGGNSANPASVTITSSIAGNIDFARSSGGPAATDTRADGVVAYVPFARDAVDVAVSGSLAASIPFTLGDATSGQTTPSLYQIYRGAVSYVYFDGTTYVGAGATAEAAPAGSTAYKLQPILPKFGSGTRKDFLAKLGNLADAANFTATSPFITDKFGGADIEEHDGTAIAGLTTGNTIAVGPFSVGQWVAQGNGKVADRRHGVTLAALNGQTPVNGAEGSYTTSTGYSAFVRDVYNIVPSKYIDDTSSAYYKAFGPGGTVCSATSTILAYGMLTGPTNGCGFDGLRAYQASASTTTLTAPASVLAGGTVDATVKVVSNGNGGGSVIIADGATAIATGSIANGSDTATVAIPASAVGSLSLKATFVPNLAGVAASTSDAAAVSVAGAASGVAVSSGKATVGKAATATVTISGPDAAGGTVSLTSGATTLATASVAGGATSVAVKYTAPSAKYSLTAVYTPKSGNVLGSTSAAVAVKAAKGTPKITVSKIKTVKSGKKSKVVITVKSGVTVTGTVSIADGKKVVVKKATLKKGKVTVNVKLKKGSHKLTVTYKASTSFKSVKKTGVKAKVS